MKLTVWVDADSCPVLVREHVVSFSKLKNVNVSFVANREIKTREFYQKLSMIICESGKDSADNLIFEKCAPNDIVITRDLLFAARLVEKKIHVMNDRGEIFTKFNIQDRLDERSFSLNLSEIGLGGGKSKFYGEKELQKFSVSFDRMLLEHVMNEQCNILPRW